ncbi:MAG: DNA repair protein RecN, partial [Clostridia bacterium]
GFLDDFGDAAHQELIARVQHAYQQWHATERKIAQARGDAQEHARRLDMLQYQLQELNAAHLRPDEEKTLEEMRNKARNAERIQDALGKCYALTVSGAGRGLGALDALRQSSAALSNISDFGEAFATLQTRMEDVMYTLEDIVDTLGDLREEMACDPKVLEKAEERLDLLSSLRRKYGATTREMLVYRDRVAEELEKMTHTDTQLEQWEKDLETQHQMLLASAATLSAARHTLAERFAHCMLAQLADLGMGQSRFEVRFERASVMSSQGFETAEFFIAPNPGEPLKPLARIASGGEMSRIMLAMKNIAADHAEIPVAIFDEIDTGISGRMAQVVAEKMAAIAHSRQVICVTHLPQITAMADAHYVVEKRTDGVVTRTYVDPLDEAGRCRELARMLGGADL